MDVFLYGDLRWFVMKPYSLYLFVFIIMRHLPSYKILMCFVKYSHPTALSELLWKRKSLHAAMLTPHKFSFDEQTHGCFSSRMGNGWFQSCTVLRGLSFADHGHTLLTSYSILYYIMASSTISYCTVGHPAKTSYTLPYYTKQYVSYHTISYHTIPWVSCAHHANLILNIIPYHATPYDAMGTLR